jgi:hypothetical protein
MRAARADGRTRRAASNDNPVTSRDDSSHQFACRRVEQERFFGERLSDFKLAGWPGWIGGFVKVGRHRVRNVMQCHSPELACHAISSWVASRTAEAAM